MPDTGFSDGATQNEDVAPLPLQGDEHVRDESLQDPTAPPTRYDITSFGADYDADGLVKRLIRGDIFIPHFQRDYVWSLKDASRFIESLLLGLPVPGIFLAKDSETNKLLVIDGQQRLKSLRYFFEGHFNPKEGDSTKRVFRLKNVQKQFDGKTYATLEEKDRIELNDSIIHATVIKQDSPSDGDTSIYHVFERLNTGGRKLTGQEIRHAVYYGSFVIELGNLNQIAAWRRVYGKESPRLKDQELIVRFLALFTEWEDYQKPMSEFLSKFSDKNRNADADKLANYRSKFESVIQLINTVLGATAFRREKYLNTAIYDSVMVGIAKRLEAGPIQDTNAITGAYERLLHDADYEKSTDRATSDETSVSTRITKAIEAFASVR